MINLRLLAGLLMYALLSGSVCSVAQRVISPEEIFDIAEAHSVRLKPYLTAEQEARHEVSVARAAYLPDVNANLSVSYLGDGFTTGRRFNDKQAAPIPHLGNGLAFTLNQPIYAGGALKGAVDLAALKEKASAYSADCQRSKMRMDLTAFYLDLYRNTNRRSVVEANIAAAKKVLADMHARYIHGTALATDITRYELLLSQLELQLVNINDNIDIINDNLVTLAGMPPSTIIIPDTTILQRSLPVDDVAQWLESAEANSPTLQLARTGVAISRKTEDIVGAERLPKISLRAGWSIDGPILTEVPPINRNLSYWYAGIAVSYNISSLYKTNKAVAKSRIATRKAQDDLEAAAEDISVAVRSTNVRYLEAYHQLTTQEKNVELAERNYSVVATRFSADMALITDMLDAANARLEAQQNLADARINLIYYYYQLLFISGKL